MRWLLVILLVLPCAAQAQWIADPAAEKTIEEGIEATYNLEFPRAEANFARITQQYPDHPAGPFLSAMVMWWRILINFDDESLDDRFFTMLDGVIDLCEKRLDTNPNDVTALFFKGGAIGFQGRLRADRGSWLKAARDGIKALPIVRKAYALEPNNYDVLLGMGIYNYYAEVIPQHYAMVKPVMIFFPSGDKKKGIDQLTLASEHSRYARYEAAYFLLMNYHSYEKDYRRALEIAESLHRRFPANPIFYRYVGRSFVAMGDWTHAYQVFNDVRAKYARREFGYDLYDIREAEYYIGKYFFFDGKLEISSDAFNMCLAFSKKLDKDGESGFQSLSTLYLGMIADLQGRRADAVKLYESVLDMKEYEGAQKEAKKYKKTPYRR